MSTDTTWYMNPYFISFAIALLCLGLAQMARRDAERGSVGARVLSHFFVLGAIVVLTLLVGLRSPNVGIDTPSYIKNMTRVQEGRFKPFEWNSPGYYVLVKIVLWLFGNNYTALFLSVGFICASVLCVTYYRYCSMPWLGLFILVSFGYYYEAVNQCREFMAVCIVLLSYQHLVKGEVWKCSILILLASTLHGSAIVALLAIPISHLKLTQYTIVAFLVLMVLGYVGAPVVRVVGSHIPVYGGYLSSTAFEYGTTNQYLVLAYRVSLTLVALWLRDRREPNGDASDVQIIIVLIGLLFQVLALGGAGFGRIATFFIAELSVLLPNLLYASNAPEHKGAVRIASIIVFCAFFIGNMVVKGTDSLTYQFFWEI